jgi:anti-anti-sigma factor
MIDPDSRDEFTIQRHGEVMVLSASPALETMDSSLIEQASELMLEPIRREPLPLVVVDLTQVAYFGSAFLSLLLRCWKMASDKGGVMVLAGVSDRARELLRLTSLDIVWPMYGNLREAIEALIAD